MVALRKQTRFIWNESSRRCMQNKIIHKQHKV